MPKVLKPYTIIPSNLYVHRDADRQVRNIIKDMGRPGYVLVSRQMGKTNLLLNAKRELETTDDVFVYVDLSNPFANAKDCFENIIDTAIETNSERFEGAKIQILDRREFLKDTPAHKQHSNELRILLNAIQGKLVIILDEIDALTKTFYSDQIFAQIRSIYFSRVNFEELSRLTYLLSGVIEPTDIIKDPKISPFNIGQKIFLNDFSNEEFKSFLTKAEITIDKVTSERIYYWTNGNPRMTWDVCSEVENIIKKEITINPTKIDRIVSDIYLATFDKPPIDNIRELVKKDREIRNVVIDIEQKKGKGITDKLKSKLYLSGIINYEENNIQIKNNIIRNCLNQDWLKSLELEEKGLFETALNLVDKGKHQEALDTFEKFLEGTDFDENQKNLCYYNMAYSSIQLSNFENALHYSELTEFDKEDETKWHYRSKIQKGLIHYYLKNIGKSLAYFKEVIDSGRKDEIYLRAILNFGSISLSSDLELHKEAATAIFINIINEVGIDRKKLKESFVSYLKTVAYFNLSQIFKHNNDVIKAKENLYLALEISEENVRPIIILSLLELEEKVDDKRKLLYQIVELLNSDKLKPIDTDPEKPLDFTFTHLKEVFLSAYEIDKEYFFDQLSEKLNLLGIKKYSIHLYELAVFSINNKNYKTGIEILTEIYCHRSDEKYNLDDQEIYNSLKLLAYFNDDRQNLSKPIEYLTLFESKRYEKIDYFDFEIIANIIFQLTTKQKFNEALKYVVLINSLKSEVDSNILINYLIIYHLELNIYRYTSNPKLLAKAQEVIEFANNEDFKHQHSNLLGDTGLDIIKQNAEVIINPKIKQVAPIIVGKSYGRNEIVKVRYKDGTVYETKFKKVEIDIRKRECFILVL